MLTRIAPWLAVLLLAGCSSFNMPRISFNSKKDPVRVASGQKQPVLKRTRLKELVEDAEPAVETPDRAVAIASAAPMLPVQTVASTAVAETPAEPKDLFPPACRPAPPEE